MFLIFLATVVIAIVIASLADIAMRIELSKQELPGEKLSWWGLRGGDQVPQTYQQLFPESRLPLIRVIPFYLVIAFAAFALIVALCKSK